MDKELDIVVTGFDVGESQAARGLAQAFDLSPAQAERFVRDVPRIAKRGASREEAERFAQTLRALGARVETLPSAAPRSTLPTRMAKTDEPAFSHDPWTSDAPPADDVGMRFRASGSLMMTSMPPDSVLNPVFPKAPLVPHDMHRMPNAAMALPSLRPEDPSGDVGDDPFHRHTDAQMPPPLVFINADAVSLEPAAPGQAKQVPQSARALMDTTDGAQKTPEAASVNARVVVGALVLTALAALVLWLATRS
jgi:hypothetical protein